MADVKGDFSEPKLEEKEIEEEMITVWMKPEEALEKMKQEMPTDYRGPFVLEREKTFLKEYFLQSNG